MAVGGLSQKIHLLSATFNGCLRAPWSINIAFGGIGLCWSLLWMKYNTDHAHHAPPTYSIVQCIYGTDNANNALMHEKRLRTQCYTLTHAHRDETVFTIFFSPILFISLWQLILRSSFCSLKYSRIVKLSSSILYIYISSIVPLVIYAPAWPYRHLRCMDQLMNMRNVVGIGHNDWAQHPLGVAVCRLLMPFRAYLIWTGSNWIATGKILYNYDRYDSLCGQWKSWDIKLEAHIRGRNAWLAVVIRYYVTTW